jgi:hypothetical protein
LPKKFNGGNISFSTNGAELLDTEAKKEKKKTVYLQRELKSNGSKIKCKTSCCKNYRKNIIGQDNIFGV